MEDSTGEEDPVRGGERSGGGSGGEFLICRD